MLFSWLGGMAGVSILKFILISLVFRTMRFGGEALMFHLFGEKARYFIEKYFNIATVLIIILMALALLILKKVQHLFI